MTPEQKKVEGLTVCRHCNHGLALSGPPIIGEHPQERARRFVMALGEHLKAKHPQEIPKGKAFIQLFADICVLQNYASEDPIVASRLRVRQSPGTRHDAQEHAFRRGPERRLGAIRQDGG